MQRWLDAVPDGIGLLAISIESGALKNKGDKKAWFKHFALPAAEQLTTISGFVEINKVETPGRADPKKPFAFAGYSLKYAAEDTRSQIVLG